MPRYKILNEEILLLWENYLNAISDDFSEHVNAYTARLLIIGICDYIFSKSVYWNYLDEKKNGGDYEKYEKKGFVGTMSTMNRYLHDKVPNCASLSLKLLSAANGYRHTPHTVESEVSILTQFAEDSRWLTVWSVYIPSHTKLYKLLCDTQKLRQIINELDGSSGLANRCIRTAIKCLTVDESIGRSKNTVGETIDILMKTYNCSRDYAVNIVVGIVEKDWRVKEGSL